MTLPTEKTTHEPGSKLGNVYAVLVGINYAANERFGPLLYCEADVAKVQSALAPSLQVLYTTQTTRVLTSATQITATRRNILNALNDLADIAGPLDTLLFFFSGHGTGDLRRSESYLIPADYMNNHELLDSWTDWISVSEVVTTMRRSEAAYKIAILDTCHSSSDDPWTDERWRQSGVHLLASCEAGQRSLEDSKLGGGVFTHFLCEGLLGAADYDGDGLVSLLELKMYLTGAVQSYLRSTQITGNSQMTPRISDAPVDLILSVSSKRAFTKEFTETRSSQSKLVQAKALLYPDRDILGEEQWQQSEYRHSLSTEQICAAQGLLKEYTFDTADSDGLAYLGLAEWLLARRSPERDFSEALKTYDAALQVNPLNIPVLIGKAYVLIDAGDPQGALKLLTEARAVDSESARVWYVIGRAYLAMSPERWEEARDALLVAVSLDNQYAPIHCDLGRVYRGMEDFEAAINEFNTALFLDPNSIEAYQGLGNTLYRRWMSSKTEADLLSAVSAFQRAIRLQPELASPYSALGNALRQLGQLEEAKRAFATSIKLNPGYSNAYYNYGILLIEQRELNEARQMLETATKLNPENWMGWNGLGMVHEEQKDFEKAAEAYERALNVHTSRSSRPSLFYNLGHAQYLSGSYSSALVNLERAVRLRPRDPRFLFDLGRCYAQLEDLEAARATLTSAAQEARSSSDPNLTTIAEHAIDLLSRLRQV